MPALVKFCKPEHNILDRCHTIRLGTFEYYRDMDPSFAIADATEGSELVDIDSLDTSTASRESLAALAGSGALAAQSFCKIENIRLNVIFPNCYIWCCSRLPDPITAEQGPKFDAAYTSFYKISDERRFGEHLGSLLMTNITRTSFAEPALDILDRLSIAEMGELQLVRFQHDVLYVEQKLSTIDEGNLNAYAREIPPLLRPLFVKPNKYANDREYRFVFLFQHLRHGPLAVRKDPVDLPVIPIQGI